jgi:hypothetical protein
MKKILITALSISLTLATPSLGAGVGVGLKCGKVNQKASSGGKNLICINSGGKLLWKLLPPTPAKPSAQPAPAPTATPTATPASTPGASSALWKDYSSSEVISRASNAIDAYFAVKRTPNQNVTVLAQDGVDPTLKLWISQGATLVAQSFAYPPSTRPFYDVVALDRNWLQDAYVKAGFTDSEVRDRLGGFDSGSPAFGGTSTNTWNAKTISTENLMIRDKVGMAQTSGHEFFHSIQERLAGRNPGRDGNEIPNWFWEGPAMFIGIHGAASIGAINFASEGRRAALDRFNNGRPETKPLLLSEVKANDGIIDPYGIGYAATEYLVAQVGVEKFLNIYGELGKGKSFPSAFETSTGFVLADFYSHFEKDRAALGFPRA